MAKACLSGTETISSSTSPAHPLSSSDISNTTNTTNTTTTTTTSSTKETTSTRPLRPRSTSTTKTSKTPNKTSEKMNGTSAASQIALPITYTPTTHRISKAKKGKRVHACEYPGCTKVFTRAEHRRRHELNHNPEALFKCSHSGCKRVFQRHDLLTRHMERHELEAQMENEAHWKQLFQSPMMSEIPQMPKPMPDHAYYPTTQPPNTMSIESLLAPEIHLPMVHEQPQIWNGLDMSMNSHTPPMIPEPIEHNPFYSYGESCPSPSSEGTTFSLNSRPSSSISSTPALVDSYPESILDCGLTSSPAPMHAELPSWDPSGADMSSSDIVPLSLDGEFIQPVSTWYKNMKSYLKNMRLTLNASSPYMNTNPLHGHALTGKNTNHSNPQKSGRFRSAMKSEFFSVIG